MSEEIPFDNGNWDAYLILFIEPGNCYRFHGIVLWLKILKVIWRTKTTGTKIQRIPSCNGVQWSTIFPFACWVYLEQSQHQTFWTEVAKQSEFRHPLPTCKNYGYCKNGWDGNSCVPKGKTSAKKRTVSMLDGNVLGLGVDFVKLNIEGAVDQDTGQTAPRINQRSRWKLIR